MTLVIAMTRLAAVRFVDVAGFAAPRTASAAAVGVVVGTLPWI